MTEPFKPQFNTQKLDLLLKKGETANFNLTVVGSYNMNFQNSLIFGEIRRKSPGFDLVKRFTASTTINSPTAQIKAYPATADKSKILSLLPVRVGDKVTIEGAIVNARVDVVTDSTLVLSSNATKTVSEARIFNRSASIAAFDFFPATTNFTISCSGVSGNSITVSNVLSQIPAGTQLVFINGQTVVGVVTVASLVQANQTSIQLTAAPPSSLAGTTARVGSSNIYARQQTALNSNTATSLPVISPQDEISPIPVGSSLYFASLGEEGWKYIGRAIVSTTYPGFIGDTGGQTISVVSAVETLTIPAYSKAMFSTIPFNTISLRLDSESTRYIESGEYAYEILAMVNSGNSYTTIRIMEGNCTFTDSWSDI